MRLINTETLELEDFFGPHIPHYAILSHTWGGEEVTLQEWVEFQKTGDLTIANKAGCKKIMATCQIAAEEDVGYVWVDTNCIDKTSSAELTEAINSMFNWYQGCRFCLVYLEDFNANELPGEVNDNVEALSNCRWFTRGWTLQELLAPRGEVMFFSQSWDVLGSRYSLQAELSQITGIDKEYLENTYVLHTASIATRMSWAANRQTTRLEDMAYCLLGIFQINMALLYGEGDRAFRRLQEEIIKVSTDQTLFAWEWPRGWSPPPDWISFLAPSPSCFRNSGNLATTRAAYSLDPSDRIFSISNYGLAINVHIHPLARPQFAFAVLLCGPGSGDWGPGAEPVRCALPLVKSTDSGSSYTRISFPPKPVELIAVMSASLKQLYIPRADVAPRRIPELVTLAGKYSSGNAHVLAVVAMSETLSCLAYAKRSFFNPGKHASFPPGILSVGVNGNEGNEAAIFILMPVGEGGDTHQLNPNEVRPFLENSMLLHVEIISGTLGLEIDMALHHCPVGLNAASNIIGSDPWTRWACPGVGTHEYIQDNGVDRRLSHGRYVIELQTTTQQLWNGALFRTLCVYDTDTVDISKR